MSGWQNFAKWKEMYHSGAEEAAIRSTLPFWHVGKQIWRRLGLKKKEANPYQEDRRNQYGSTIGGRRWHRSSLPRRWLNEIQLRQRHMCRIRPSFVQELKPMTGENALWTLPLPTVGTTTNRDWKMSEFQGDTSPSIDTHSYERKQRKSTDSGLFSTECWKTKNNLGKQGFRIDLSQFSNFLDWESILCWISLLSVKKYSGWRKKISCLSGLVHVLDIPIKLNTYPKW